jgi:hypothetical protein
LSRGPTYNFFLIATFVALLVSPPIVQMIVELRSGEWPRALEVFSDRPTPENLRRSERALEAASVTARTLRPWMQAAQFFALREAGEKAVVGREGWLFYGPGVSAITARPKPGESTPREAVAAVQEFRSALAARGIRFIIMPAPNKECVYPDRLSNFAGPPARIISAETRAFFAECEGAGIEVVDLFALYRSARAQSATPLYLTQDSHWSPAGMELAAHAVAERIGPSGEARYDRKPAPVQRHGDLVRMLRAAPIEARLAPETVACTQIVRRDTGALYVDDPASDVLVLGDSFLRIYQQDEPGSAGFTAHLACALGRPVASLVNDGGASTLVRQELFRRPQLLASAKLVVWEFVERDLRLGTDGWQHVPLPPKIR